MLPRSSSTRALRSVEKGVLSSRNGLLSRCFAIWPRRALADRDVGAICGGRRIYAAKAEEESRWLPRVNINIRTRRPELEMSSDATW